MESRFYENVSKWIASSSAIATLDMLAKYIQKSAEPVFIKNKLFNEIDIRKRSLKSVPVFQEVNGETYLVDEHGHPKVFTTRFSAICKVAELKMRGLPAELVPGNVFYRIIINCPVADESYGVPFNP